MQSLPPGYRIVTAQPEHVPLLGEIERSAAQIFPEADVPFAMRFGAVDPDRLSEAQARGALWVALESEGQPVGFAYVHEETEFAHLAELDVHPDHGRRGLGAALVEKAVAWARARGKAGITLSTFRHLAWNAPFYERLGFEAFPSEDAPAFIVRLLREEEESGLDPANRVAMWIRF